MVVIAASVLTKSGKRKPHTYLCCQITCSHLLFHHYFGNEVVEKLTLCSSSVKTVRGHYPVQNRRVASCFSKAGTLCFYFWLLNLVQLSSDKQHTFIETEAVRYVYQPMEDLYMVVITNKSSNILEDLDTLHLLTKLVIAWN